MTDEALDVVENLPYENSGDGKDIDKVLDLLQKHYLVTENEIVASNQFFRRS